MGRTFFLAALFAPLAGCTAFAGAELPTSGSENETPSAGETSAAEACGLAVIANLYDGPTYWGTLALKNTGSKATTGITVSIDLSAGARCHYASEGWTYRSEAGHCTFTNATVTLAAGARTTFNYAGSSPDVEEASNVVVKAARCTSE